MDNQTSIDNIMALHDEAVSKLRDFITGTETKMQPMEVLRIKAAMSAYNGSTREMATWRAKDAVQLTVIKTIIDDKKELRKYIEATMPNYIPKFLK